MKPRLTSWLALFLVLTLLCPQAGLADQPVDLLKAARVKAAYLYHLARLTTWPQASFADNADSLRICIVGEDSHDLVGLFHGAGHDLRAGQHPLSIERLDPDLYAGDPTVLDSFHVVFFTEDCQDFAFQLLADGISADVLTVGEIDGFCEGGGMVGFEIGDGRVRLEVNRDAVRTAELQLSAEFMQHAVLVESRRRGSD